MAAPAPAHHPLRDRITLGLETVRAHRLRSALLILGVAIGVATLMAMVAVLAGLGEKIKEDISSSDQVIVYVAKYEVMVTGADEESLSRPDVEPADAEAIERLAPAVSQAEYYIEAGNFTLFHYRGKRTRPCGLIGTGPRFHDFYLIPVAAGRYLTESDIEHRRRVCVLGHGPANDLFPNVDPIGKRVRLGDIEHEVVGVFAERKSLAGALGENFAAIPYSTFRKDWKDDFDEGYVIMTVAPGKTAAEVMEEARAVMRSRRGLVPGQRDNFAVFSADAIEELVGRITGPIALALVLISSIGLLVGGIGVMNLMLVSVTERTREIGIRMAIGARRRDILLEVLVEAGTLTGLGGVVGLILGGIGAAAVAAVTNFPAKLHPGMIVAGLLFSISIGLFFGLYPASRASRLDPVVALRQE
jgi:putative ABC transport system permease protein